MGVFEKAIIPADEITDFIPQRSPIVMVDEFFGVDGDLSLSGLTVAKDNIFCEEGVLSDCGVIEHIAQSAALRVGYIYKSAGKDVPLGFIGSVNKLKIYDLPKVGETLRTEIRVEQEVMNITLISAQSRVADKMVAECKMKIYLQE
ncbi:MAG: hydroxymyristoyl-ACP dehydratase [Rikenellaceae bacterium]